MILTAVSFVVVLGVVVFVHELGHFAAAKFVGAKVEAFSIGFGKLIGIKRGDTEYRLGYIPLGGYVKIAGMVDEFMEGEEGLKGEPWEFQSKNTLQKMFMISAGVLMNFLMGFLLYSAVTMAEGEPVSVEVPTVGALAQGYPAEQAGLLPGDRFLTIDGDPVGNWEEFRSMSRRAPMFRSRLRGSVAQIRLLLR